jgi:hypothetical protein
VYLLCVCPWLAHGPVCAYLCYIVMLRSVWRSLTRRTIGHQLAAITSAKPKCFVRSSLTCKFQVSQCTCWRSFIVCDKCAAVVWWQCAAAAAAAAAAERKR